MPGPIPAEGLRTQWSFVPRRLALLSMPSRTPARLAVCALLGAALGSPDVARGAQIEGIDFADAVRIRDADVPIQGVGLLRYRLFIKAYVAAFYAAGTAPVQDPLTRTPRRLEIEYFWPLEATQFAEATRAGLAANLPEAELASLEPKIVALNALYEDIEPGDRYALTYANGATELSKNGRTLGAIPGDAFGRAVFAIWLGPSPLSPGLKGQLLSGTPR